MQNHNPPLRVYAIHSAHCRAVKIGITRNVQERFDSIQASNPCTLTLIADVAGNSLLEYRLLNRFRDIVIRGEWFAETPELLQFLAEDIHSLSECALRDEKAIMAIDWKSLRQQMNEKKVSARRVANACGLSFGAVNNVFLANRAGLVQRYSIAKHFGLL